MLVQNATVLKITFYLIRSHIRGEQILLFSLTPYAQVIADSKPIFSVNLNNIKMYLMILSFYFVIIE